MPLISKENKSIVAVRNKDGKLLWVREDLVIPEEHSPVSVDVLTLLANGGIKVIKEKLNDPEG